MSPRTPRPEAASPPSSALDPTRRAQLAQLIAAHAERPGAMLPLLHAVQDAWGHIPDEAVPDIAHALNRSRAEVHGMVTFYHHFRREAPGRHIVQVCMAEACQACGADALMQASEQILGCAAHQTRADGAVTLAPVYCLGLCASSPALQIGDRVHGRVDTDHLRSLLAPLVQGQGGAA